MVTFRAGRLNPDVNVNPADAFAAMDALRPWAPNDDEAARCLVCRKEAVP